SCPLVKMALDDSSKHLVIRLIDLETDAAAQKSRWKFPLAVRRQNDEWEMSAADAAFIYRLCFQAPPLAHGNAAPRIFQPSPRKFGNGIFSPLEDVEQIAGKIEIAFVDFINQQRPGPIGRQECGAQGSKLDEPSDVSVVIVPIGFLPFQRFQ